MVNMSEDRWKRREQISEFIAFTVKFQQYKIIFVQNNENVMPKL